MNLSPPPNHAVGKARGRVVASYTAYEEAERAVDRLSDAGFPVEEVAIVVRGLRLGESVPAPVGYGGAAVNGAVTGAFAGLLFGALFGLFSWIEPLVGTIALAFYGILFGAVAGAFVGVIVHAVAGRRRNFATLGATEAERYDVVVNADGAAEAEIVLALGPRARSAGSPTGGRAEDRGSG